ncbi:unnamed protein product [Victoria cruziana]
MLRVSMLMGRRGTDKQPKEEFILLSRIFNSNEPYVPDEDSTCGPVGPDLTKFSLTDLSPDSVDLFLD